MDQLQNRLKLQTILEEILGSRNVYFQPPDGTQLKYPCILYVRSSENTRYADNVLYNSTRRYTVTVIDRDPDSYIPEKVGNLPMCSFNRHFKTDSLNHAVYNLYF